MLDTDRGALRAAPGHRNTRRYLQYSYKCLNATPGSRLDPTGHHLTDKLTINISVENFTNQSRHTRVQEMEMMVARLSHTQATPSFRERWCTKTRFYRRCVDASLVS